MEAEDDDIDYIHMTVNIHGLKFSIPCGEGDQDVKWLALVAAQRYCHKMIKLAQVDHGRVRPQLDRFNK